MNQLLVIEDDAEHPREPGRLLRRSSSGTCSACETWSPRPAAALAEQPVSTWCLLDLRLPDGDGLDVLRSMRKRSGDKTPVIVLTAHGETEQRVLGLQTRCRRLRRQAVQRARARRPHPGGAAPRRAADPTSLRARRRQTIDIWPPIASRARRATCYRLLPKEAELLAHLLRHAGPGVLSRDDLLSRRMGATTPTPTTRTVDTHVFQLRKKIEDDPSNPRLLHTVHGVGYVLRGD